MKTKYCDDPDNCTYSDCPTAFCDKYATEDLRYRAMRIRFCALTNAALIEMLRQIDRTVFDTYNYHEGKFCPMGIALGCHKYPNPSDRGVKEWIASNGFVPTNILKGVPGYFYHGSDAERKRDLISLVCEILRGRALGCCSVTDQHPASPHLSDRPKSDSLFEPLGMIFERQRSQEAPSELASRIEAALSRGPS